MFTFRCFDDVKVHQQPKKHLPFILLVSVLAICLCLTIEIIILGKFINRMF